MSCKQLITAPSIPGASSGAAKSVMAPTGITASQGLKRKITISWTEVGNAAYYLVYYAESPTSEFEIVSPPVQKNTYDDSVGAGKTGYYKVQAVRHDGTKSDFSSVVKGTTLATPLITGGDVKETSVTLSWYMENARDIKSGNSAKFIDNYESLLRYEVVCESSSDTREVPLSGNVDTYTFENLNSNTNYVCYVKAYLVTQQGDVETSAKVSAATLQSYIPQAPEVSADQGVSAKEINLRIKLPQMCQVNISKEQGKVDDMEFPLCFKIERKKITQDDGDYTTVVNKLYYDGNTSAPTDYSKYEQGAVISWTDKSADLERGEKYVYRVTSYVDTNFKQDFNKDIHSAVGKTAAGWMAARPEFDITHLERNFNADHTAVESVSFNFNATWQDLGKAESYKFAIKQTKDGVGSEWIKDKDGKDLFDSLEKVNALSKIFDSPAAQAGSYKYAFYIIPASYSTAQDGAAYAIDADGVESNTTVLVTNDVNLPKAEIKVTGGYTNKVPFEFALEDDVEYKIERRLLNKDGSVNTTKEINISTNGASGLFKGEDTDGVAANSHYAYILHATKGALTISSETEYARTLGAPKAEFSLNDLDYDSITVKFPAISAAIEYTVTLGNPGGFGNGQNIVFDKDAKIKSQTVNSASSVKFENGIFTVVIEKPYGYNNATLAGNPTDLWVKVKSSVDEITSEPTKVNVIGPANIVVMGTDKDSLKKDSITIKWNKIENAKGYVVWRTRPGYGTAGDTKEDSVDVYYVSADGSVVKNNGDVLKSDVVEVNGAADKITLIDKQKKATDTKSSWQKNQQSISWGLEYKYCVLPVLNESDAVEPESFEFAYSGLDSQDKTASGFTRGYGLDITASKADYTDKVVITWQIPASTKISETPPKLCYRKTGNTFAEWNRIDNLDSSNTSYSVEDGVATYNFALTENLTSKYEYVVTYDSDYASGSNGISFDTTYIEYLNKTHASVGDTETANCGYMFTLPNGAVNAIKPTSDSDDSTFTETVRWRLYTAEGSREKGPGDGMNTDPYTLYVKNLNCSAEWLPIATLDKNGNITKIEKDLWYDVELKIEKDGETERVTKITPNGIGTKTKRMTRNSGTADAYAGTHNGLLKVQRDYKHYYMIEAKRINASGEKVVARYSDYTYRKITDDEFVKGITLIVADALFQMGIPGNTQNDWKVGSDALGYFYSSYPAGTNRKFEWGTKGNDYTHTYRAGLIGDSSSFASAWTINIPQTSGDLAVEGTIGNGQLYRLPWGTIKATHSSGLSSYQGYVVLSVGDKVGASGGMFGSGAKLHWRASIQYNHTPNTAPNQNGIVINESGSNNTTYDSNADLYYTVKDDKDKFLTWFPYDIGTKHSSGDATKNTSLPTYQGTWWQAR